MPFLQLKSRIQVESLSIPAVFIDYYLPSASGDDVRVYLYLLRAMMKPDEGLSLGDISAALDISDKELMRSLSYWEEAGLVRLSFNSSHMLESIVFEDIASAADKERITDEKAAVPQRKEPERTAYMRPVAEKAMQSRHTKDPSSDDEFQAILFMMNSVIGRDLTNAETEQFYDCYVNQGRSADAMEMLLNTCQKSMDTPDFAYVMEVAQDMFELPPAASAPAPTQKPAPKTADKSVPYTPTRAEYDRMVQDSSFQALALMAESILRKPLNAPETERLCYWYINFGCNLEVVESLLDYCQQNSNGKPGMGYLEAVAQTWFSNGIKTIEEAREYSSRYNKAISTVLKALGYGPRNPRDVNEENERMIRTWTNEWELSLDVIRHACELTAARNVNGDRFSYANRILDDWHRAGVRTVEDAKRLQQEHAQKSKAPKQPQVNTSAASAHNFKERDIDLDAEMFNRIRRKQQK